MSENKYGKDEIDMDCAECVNMALSGEFTGEEIRDYHRQEFTLEDIFRKQKKSENYNRAIGLLKSVLLESNVESDLDQDIYEFLVEIDEIDKSQSYLGVKVEV